MPSAIGVRVYQIQVTEKGKVKALDLDDAGLSLALPKFADQFVSANATANQHSALERSWYFDKKASPGLDGSRGYVQYGTFGFESNFVDANTKAKNYRRKTTDVEEIPLFYEIWFPAPANYALAAFQSFQGRSCVSIVMAKMAEAFAKANPGHVIRFRKLLPTGTTGGLYSQAPVKELRLVRRNAPTDVTDRFLRGSPHDPIDFEISMKARRKGALGILKDVASSLHQNAQGVVMHDGIKFDEAIADVRVGKKLRPVYLLGSSSDAGVIDLTDAVTRGADGHPTFASVSREVSDIMKDFFKTLSGK